jgi:predicted HicB family RNase H-like nuclease
MKRQPRSDHEIVNATIRMRRGLHKEIKMCAAELDTSMQDMIEQALREHMARVRGQEDGGRAG